MNWIELHTDSRYSERLSMIDPSQLISSCARNGCKTVAITDRNSVTAYLEAEAAAEKYGVRLLYGITVDCLDRDDRYAVTLLAASQQGREQIFSLMKLLQERDTALGAYVTREELEAHRAGLLFGASAVDGQLVRAIQLRKSEAYLLRAAREYNYIELPLEPYDVSAKLLRIAGKSGIMLCAVQNGILPSGSGELDRHVYRAVARSRAVCEEAEPLTSGRNVEEEFWDLYMLPEEAGCMMSALYNDPAKLVNGIGPMPTVSHWLREGQEQLHQEAMGQLREFVQQAWEGWNGDRTPDAQARVQWELERVDASGAALSFVLLKMVSRALAECGYPMQLMGTWNSSFLLYLLGVVELNPLELMASRVPTLFCTSGQLESVEIRIPSAAEPIIQGLLKKRFGEQILGLRPMRRMRNEDDKVKAILDSYLEHADRELKEQLEENEAFQSRLAYESGQDGPSGLAPIVILPDGHKRELLPLVANHYGVPELPVTRTYIPGLTSFMSTKLAALDILTECVRLTGVPAEQIPLEDEAVYSAIREQSMPWVKEVSGMCGYSFEEGQKSIPELVPFYNLNDLSRVMSLSHGSGVWSGSQELLLRSGVISPEQLICCREDVFRYMVEHGTSEEQAHDFMHTVYMGKIKHRGLADEEAMLLHSCGVETWFADVCKRIDYLFPGCHTTGSALLLVRLVWYAVHYPKETGAAIRAAE